LGASVEVDDQVYASMVQSIVAIQEHVALLSPTQEGLLFGRSGPDDEV
jgi:hypothetical protein